MSEKGRDLAGTGTRVYGFSIKARPWQHCSAKLLTVLEAHLDGRSRLEHSDEPLPCLRFVNRFLRGTGA
jgi:hypothetical protein